MPRYCEQCGMGLHAGAKFCGDCGRPVPPTEIGHAAATVETRPQSKPNGWLDLQERAALVTARTEIVAALAAHTSPPTSNYVSSMSPVDARATVPATDLPGRLANLSSSALLTESGEGYNVEPAGRNLFRAAAYFILFLAAVATYLFSLLLVAIVLPPAGLALLAVPVLIWRSRRGKSFAPLLFGPAETRRETSARRDTARGTRELRQQQLHRKELEHDVHDARVSLRYLGGHPELPNETSVQVTRTVEQIGSERRDCVLLRGAGRRALIPVDAIQGIRFGREFRRSAGGALAGAVVASALTLGMGTLVGAAIGGRRRADNTMSLTFSMAHGDYEVLFEKCSARDYTKLVRLANLGSVA